MRTDKSAQYENFTRIVYQAIADYDGIATRVLKQNHKLQGKSGATHQIDVYWEYEIDGKTYRTIIECKNYKRCIPKEKVCALKGIIDDFDGVKGVLATCVGFQKGAQIYAKHHGIILKEIRPPKTDETIIAIIDNTIDWEIRHTLFLIDDKWAEENNPRLIPWLRHFHSTMFCDKAEHWKTATHFPLMYKADGVIRNSKGQLITTVEKLGAKIPNHPTEDFPVVFKYDDAYIDTRSSGLVKIKEVVFSYDVRHETKSIALDGGDLVKAIIKDVLNGEFSQVTW